MLLTKQVISHSSSAASPLSTSCEGWVGACTTRFLTNMGYLWDHQNAMILPNMYGIQLPHFHSAYSDWIIWTEDKDCSGRTNNCHTKAHFSCNNGWKWALVKTYECNCAWAQNRCLVDYHKPCEVVLWQNGFTLLLPYVSTHCSWFVGQMFSQLSSRDPYDADNLRRASKPTSNTSHKTRGTATCYPIQCTPLFSFVCNDGLCSS